jgi:hypothetical protein
MLRQFLVGAAVSVCNIAIHAFLMAAVIWAARITGAITGSRQSVRLIAVMSATVSLLMAAHFSEVLVWAWAYAIVGVALMRRKTSNLSSGWDRPPITVWLQVRLLPGRPLISGDFESSHDRHFG